MSWLDQPAGSRKEPNPVGGISLGDTGKVLFGIGCLLLALTVGPAIVWIEEKWRGR